jgi:hypothetical protein
MKAKMKVKKHDHRPDLTSEHPFGNLVQIIHLIIFYDFIARAKKNSC